MNRYSSILTYGHDDGCFVNTVEGVFVAAFYAAQGESYKVYLTVDKKDLKAGSLQELLDTPVTSQIRVNSYIAYEGPGIDVNDDDDDDDIIEE